MKSRLFTPLIFACQAFTWQPVQAQNMLTVPMEVLWVSNPDLVAESRGNVALYRINPQYTLQMIHGSARTELALGGMIEKSSNTDLSANRTLPSVRVLWESASPVDVFRLRASLEESSTRETEFAEFGRVTLDSTQRTGTLGGSWTRNLTAVSSVELALSHARQSYDTPSLVDYSESLASADYRIEASANSRYWLSTRASRLSPEGTGEGVSRAELGLGYEFDLTEGVRLNATAGAVRTNALRSETDPVGALRLTYTGEKVGYVVAWSREVSASGSTAGYTRSENFEASMTYPFTIDTSMSLGVGHAKSLEPDGSSGLTAYARIRSELTRFWALTMGLEQRRARSSIESSARGHVVSVGLQYSHPDF